jgi:hypothetical protein
MRRYRKEEDAIILACIRQRMPAVEIAKRLTEAGHPRDYGSVYMHCRDVLGIEIPKRFPKPVKPKPKRTRARFVISGLADGSRGTFQVGARANSRAIAEQWQMWLDEMGERLRDANGHPTFVQMLQYAFLAGAEKARRERGEGP